MTTKPKARKFRIKRTAPALGSASAKPETDAAPEKPAPTAEPRDPVQKPEHKTGEVASNQQVQTENTIDEIRQEGLTGRQLRMARRVAQKHGSRRRRTLMLYVC